MDISPADDSLAAVQELIWALLDDQISDADFRRLEDRLRDDEEARRLYLECVSMHVHLEQHFGGGDDDSPASPPLGAPLDLSYPSDDSPLSDAAY